MGLVVEAEAEKLPSGHPAFCAPDLISQVYGILSTDYNRWAGTRPSGVYQATHTTPDMPVWELSRVGPPVRNVFPGAFRTNGRLLVLHGALLLSIQGPSG
jgi:hypothetical protein